MFVIAAVLLMTGIQPDPPCCKRTDAFVAATSSVETHHKIGHFITTSVLTTSAYGAARYFGASPAKSRVISVAVSLSAIFAKELYDYHTAAHSFSSEDVLIGAAGTATGLLLAAKIHWPEDDKTPSMKASGDGKSQ
jgi:uncharacterized protein YfiM (DUF2279 family)